MLNQFYKNWIIFSLPLILSIQISTPAFAKDKATYICEDDITTASGQQWGGSKKLPLKRVVDIQDCLINSTLGKVTAGRHGDNKSLQLGELFGTKLPFPGERYLISIWGSKIEGCFVEMIIQDAPVNGEVNLKSIVATKLNLGIGGQPIELPAEVGDSTTKSFKQDYAYTQYVSGANQEYISSWYMTRNIFWIDSQVLTFLRNAPVGEVKGRLTFADNSTQLFTIQPETVKSWDAAFGFNPTCKAPEEEV
jgi:hypothetical protein